MIEWLDGKISEVTSLLQAAATVGAIALVIFAYIKTRTLVAVLVAAITAGVFLFSVHNPDWWQSRVGEETEVEGGAPVGPPSDELGAVTVGDAQ